MSNGCLTTEFFSTLSSLPSLRKLLIDLDTYAGPGRVQDIGSFAYCHMKGNFGSLESLVLQGHLLDLSTFFGSIWHPHSLRELVIDRLLADPAEALASLLAILPSSCPNIITLRCLRERSWDGDRDEEGPVSVEDLGPLQYFPKLETFELVYEKPIDGSDEQLATLLSRCPMLTSLHLTSDPSAVDYQSGFTLASLAQLAQQRPHMQSLGLYLHVASVANLPAIIQPFKTLHDLRIASSFIITDDPDTLGDIVAYLRQLLPPTCIVHADRIPTEMLSRRDMKRAMINQRLDAWTAVKKSLAILT